MTPDEIKELMDKNLITQVLNPVDVVNNMETPPAGGCDCTDYVLPTASATTLGGVKVGNGLDIDADGTLHAAGSDYKLPRASDTTLGGIRIGDGLTIDDNGTLDVNIGTGFGWNKDDGFYVEFSQLPVASENTLGGIRIGDGLTIDTDGKLSTAGGGSDYTLPIAGSDVLGGVMVGTDGGLNIGADGSLNIKLGSGLCYNNEYPGVRIKTGNGLGLTADGTLYVTGGGSDYELPKATATTLGGVMVGDGLAIDDNGSLHTTMAGSVSNPNVKLGGVKVGTAIGSRCPYAKIGINSTTGEIGLNYGSGLKTNSSMGSTYHSALEINYGDGLNIDSGGKLSVKTGSGLKIGSAGELYVTTDTNSSYTLGTASKTTLGGIKIGTGFDSSCVQLGIDAATGIACVSCKNGLKVNNNSQCIVADIDYIYEQILAKLQNDGYIQ